MLLCEPNIPSQEDLCRVYLTIENIAFVVITEQKPTNSTKEFRLR